MISILRVKKYSKIAYELLRDTILDFIGGNVMKYCAALSYYTVFSLAPMLLLIISVTSILYGKEAIEGQLFHYIKNIVGVEASLQIQDIIKNISLKKSSTIATVIGFITFFIGATGVFGEIQSSINTIWGLKAKPKRGIINYLVNRLLSFAMVVTIGFLLIVSMIASTVVSFLNERLNDYLPNTNVILMIVNNSIALIIISSLFTLIFKYLPDSLVRWKDAFVGAVFTSILFFIGKYVISLYLSSPTSHSAFGAAGSMIVILLWIYYSSILLYFGAIFTKTYAIKYGYGISPNKFSVEVLTIEKEVKS